MMVLGLSVTKTLLLLISLLLLVVKPWPDLYLDKVAIRLIWTTDCACYVS
jgi:hypothetical protein